MPSPALSPASSLALARARPASAAPEALGGDAVWRADELARNVGATRPTGHAALDAVLPGGGWPVGALVEVLQPQAGQGEWRLLLPALGVSPAGALVLVNPPHRPFVPALAAQGLDAARLLMLQGPTLARDAAARVWACEQALRCAGVSAVLAWLPQVRPEQLRRLQMAAQNFPAAAVRDAPAGRAAGGLARRAAPGARSRRGRRRAVGAPAQAPRPAADHVAGAAGAARAAAGAAGCLPPAASTSADRAVGQHRQVAVPPSHRFFPCRFRRESSFGRRGLRATQGSAVLAALVQHPSPCWRGSIRRSRCTGSPCCPCRPLSRRPHSGQDEVLRLWSWRALQFTPRVAVADGVVVLEIAASERLFGGRRALLRLAF
jgi:protein ImuA